MILSSLKSTNKTVKKKISFLNLLSFKTVFTIFNCGFTLDWNIRTNDIVSFEFQFKIKYDIFMNYRIIKFIYDF